MSINLKKATIFDLENVYSLVQHAKAKMHSEGNTQWSGEHPRKELFVKDINNGNLWLAVENDVILGVASLSTEQTDDYKIVGCDMDKPSIVIHRIAVHPNAQGRGIGSKLFQKAHDLAVELNHNIVRIDTHKNNKSMLHLIEKKYEYKYIGEITLSGRGPPPELRNLYEKVII